MVLSIKAHTLVRCRYVFCYCLQTLHIWIVENSSGQVCQQPTWVCVSVKLFLSWTWKEKTQTENRIIYNLEGIILSRATTLLEIFCPINLFQENITKEATTWYYQIFYYYQLKFSLSFISVIPSSLAFSFQMVGATDQKIWNQITVFVKIMENWSLKCSGTDFSA